MPRPPEVIKQYRTSALQTTPTLALETISNLETEDSIPVIIAIIKELRTILNRDLNDSLKPTKDCLAEADRILSETDDIQNRNTLRQGWYFKSLTKAKITAPLDILATQISTIKVTASTKELWQEAALWLEGLFKHTDRLYKHEDSGELSRDSQQKIIIIDNDFKEKAMSLLGLTKWQIASYYHSFAENIKKQLEAFNSTNEAQAAPPTDTAAVCSMPEPVMVGRPSFDFRIEPQAEGFSLVTMRVSSADIPRIEHALDKAFATNLLQEKLMRSASDDTETQIQILRVGIQQHGLLREEEAALRFWAPTVSAHCCGYKVGGSYVQQLKQYVAARPNTDLADTLIDQLSISDDIKQQLEIVCTIRDQLVARESYDLRRDIDRLLLQACTLIRSATPYFPSEHTSRMFATQPPMPPGTASDIRFSRRLQ